MPLRAVVFYWLPAAAWTAFIFLLSSRPPDDFRPFHPFLFPHADKLIHLVEFAVLGFLLIRALSHQWPQHKHLTFLFCLAFLFCTLYGIADELHQSRVQGREVELLDWLADTMGALIGLFGFLMLQKRRKLTRA